MPAGVVSEAVVGDDLLDVYGVAYHLGLSPRTAYRLMSDGTLAASGWPKQVRRSDVEEYLRGSRIQPGQLRHLTSSSSRRP